MNYPDFNSIERNIESTLEFLMIDIKSEFNEVETFVEKATDLLEDVGTFLNSLHEVVEDSNLLSLIDRIKEILDD